MLWLGIAIGAVTVLVVGGGWMAYSMLKDIQDGK